MDKYNFISPQSLSTPFVVYSKSGCSNCTRVKQLIESNCYDIHVVDCDEYLLENKDAFLCHIESLAGKPHKTFPIVFYENQFIGGLLDTMHFIDTQLLFSTKKTN
jgi:glutaredoxin